MPPLGQIILYNKFVPRAKVVWYRSSLLLSQFNLFGLPALDEFVVINKPVERVGETSSGRSAKKKHSAADPTA